MAAAKVKASKVTTAVTAEVATAVTPKMTATMTTAAATATMATAAVTAAASLRQRRGRKQGCKHHHDNDPLHHRILQLVRFAAATEIDGKRNLWKN